MSGGHRNGEEYHSSNAAGQRSAVGGGNGRGMLPLGMQTFRTVRESGAYYVDKTQFAHRMVTQGRCFFLSRPRRFGKSLLVSMLKELFEGSEELFKGLYIHSRWDWSESRPVVRLSFGRGDFTEPGTAMKSAVSQMAAIRRRAGMEPDHIDEPAAERLILLLEELHRRSGRRVAVLVDEYDKPILDAIGDSDLARQNRNMLRGFYSAVKDADEHVRFVFLTGVSKFSKVSLFSGLNNLKDVTLDPVYSSVCGFTEADLDRVFSVELEGLDREQVREWYNGYSWLGLERVYNPYDVLMLLDEREFKPYWFETGSPRFLVDTLIERGAPIPALGRVIAGERLLSTFDVDRIATEALLFQTGYLTITGVRRLGNKVLYELSYPNLEVRESLNEVLLEQLMGPEVLLTADGVRLLDILSTGDTRALRRLFDGFFANIPHQWHSSGTAARYEAYYASVFYTYFAALGFDPAVEDSTSRGRVDMAVTTPQRIWLFEFKTTTTADADTPTADADAAANDEAAAALQQMRDRCYPDKYRSRGLPIILVGIAFNSDTRSIAAYQTAVINPDSAINPNPA